MALAAWRNSWRASLSRADGDGARGTGMEGEGVARNGLCTNAEEHDDWLGNRLGCWPHRSRG